MDQWSLSDSDDIIMDDDRSNSPLSLSFLKIDLDMSWQTYIIALHYYGNGSRDVHDHPVVSRKKEFIDLVKNKFSLIDYHDLARNRIEVIKTINDLITEGSLEPIVLPMILRDPCYSRTFPENLHDILLVTKIESLDSTEN